MLRESRTFLFTSAALALAAAAVSSGALAASASEELAECLYQNTSSADRTTFVQWAYVTIGKTSAAKSVATIPTAKITAVEKKAQTALTQVVLKSCPKQAMNVLLADPKNGLESTLTSLAGKLIQGEMQKRASPLLSLTITDLLGKR